MAMEPSSKLHAHNLQSPLDFYWPYNEDFSESNNTLELPPLDSLFGFNSLPFPFHFDHFPHFEFENLGNFGVKIFSPDEHIPPLCDVPAAGAVKSELQEVKTMIERGFSSWNEKGEEKRVRNGSRKGSGLKLEEIQKHFHIPISEAARELKVGLTVLKKRCRQLNIMRWPHRKFKSLKSLINNVKEMGLTKEMNMLEEQKKLMEKLPDMELTDGAKRLRQTFFKAKYTKRRSMAYLH